MAGPGDPVDRSGGGGPDDARIRTFLIADVRGWTLFTQERGDEAAAKLGARFADIVREVVEARGGTLLELRGDEALCVFTSAREAIRSAVELQDRFVQETVARPELPLTVGIGIDAGEAVPVQGGYRGGALNLAARLCGQARAGEILASREVTHLARRLDGVRYEDRGSMMFKNIPDPVAVTRVVPEGEDPAERLRPFTPTAPAPPTRRSRRWAIAAGIAAVLVLVVVSIPLLGSDEPGPITLEANSVAVFDPGDRSLGQTTPLGDRPGPSAIGFGSVWVTQPDRGIVIRLDLDDGAVTDRIPVGSAATGIAIGEGAVWVTSASDGTVNRIDTDSGQVSQTLPVGTTPSAIAFGNGRLWIADPVGAALLVVDPVSAEVALPIPLPGQPTGVTFTPEGVWVSVAPNTVVQVDATDQSVLLRQTVGSGPSAIVSAFGSTWVANTLDGTVTRLDPATGSVRATIEVGEGPNALVAAGDGLWVGNEFDDSVTVIDPRAGEVLRTMPVGGASASLAADANGVWLAVGASATEHRGGTFTISSTGEGPRSLDPGGSDDELAWQILPFTNDGLLAYRKVAGPQGATLVPDLASALPEVSADGLTYRFPLRSGILYSTGEPVLPEDFRHGIERTLLTGSDWASYYSTITGAEACVPEDPEACDLTDSIVTDDGSVTIHLTHPDPDLPHKLALPPAFPVPSSIPFEDQGLDGVPATGPYMIEHADAEGIELVRNPEFEEWSGAAQPDGFVDRIRWRFQEDATSAFDRLESGALDWMIDRPTDEDLATLEAEHPDRIVTEPLAATVYVGFDFHAPPFDDARVRQAINLAIDRERLVELFGGPTAFTPTCQILPPNFQGYEAFCPSTLEPEAGVWSAPDVERAQALIAEAGASDARVTAWASDGVGIPAAVDAMRYVVEVMKTIGLDARLKIEPDPEAYATVIYGGRAPAYLTAWFTAYPGAGDWIPPFFLCEMGGKLSGVCAEDLDAAIQEALRLQGTDPGAANEAWIRIEHRLVEDAVWAPIANPIATYAISDRVENVQVHPQWGILLSRLWVK
jgi:peptide/nickel transport system substrate-binding protein